MYVYLMKYKPIIIIIIIIIIIKRSQGPSKKTTYQEGRR